MSRSPFSSAIALTATAMLLVATETIGAPKPTPTAVPPPLVVAPQSSLVGDKFLAYVGPGLTTSPPSKTVEEGLVPSILTMPEGKGKTVPYSAIEVTAKEGFVFLRVDVKVTNPASTKQPFRLRDFGIKEKGTQATVGAGIGRVPFAKDQKTWSKIDKQKPIMIDPGKTIPVAYLFTVPASETSWKLAYKGQELARIDIDPKATPLGGPTPTPADPAAAPAP